MTLDVYISVRNPNKEAMFKTKAIPEVLLNQILDTNVKDNKNVLECMFVASLALLKWIFIFTLIPLNNQWLKFPYQKALIFISQITLFLIQAKQIVAIFSSRISK